MDMPVELIKRGPVNKTTTPRSRYSAKNGRRVPAERYEI
jgi:hypothetical protein